MNLDMVRPKNKTEDLSPAITKNCQTLINQTHRKAEEALEFQLTKSRETFSIKPSINPGLDSIRMVGLTSLEVYKFIFIITEENNNFEIYTDTFDEFSFTEIKDELEQILDI